MTVNVLVEVRAGDREPRDAPLLTLRVAGEAGVRAAGDATPCGEGAGSVVVCCTPPFETPGPAIGWAVVAVALGHGVRLSVPACTPPERSPPTTGSGVARSHTGSAFALPPDAASNADTTKTTQRWARFIRHTVPASPQIIHDLLCPNTHGTQ
jgi:hypothetical protein